MDNLVNGDKSLLFLSKSDYPASDYDYLGVFVLAIILFFGFNACINSDITIIRFSSSERILTSDGSMLC